MFKYFLGSSRVHAFRICQAARAAAQPITGGPPAVAAHLGRYIDIAIEAEKRFACRPKKHNGFRMQRMSHSNHSRFSIDMEERLLHDPGRLIKRGIVAQIDIDAVNFPTGTGTELNDDDIGKFLLKERDESVPMFDGPAFGYAFAGWNITAIEAIIHGHVSFVSQTRLLNASAGS